VRAVELVVGNAFADGKGTMGTLIKKQLDEALAELETISDQIRLKLHLASMEANELWNTKLEPRLTDARKHAEQAKDSSKTAIAETIEVLRQFQKTL
jgi:hypothetical protein